MFKNDGYPSEQFNDSLAELAGAQELYRQRALIGQAPPYFIVSAELAGNGEGNRGIALATVDQHVVEGETATYGELFTFESQPDLKLTSDVIRLHDSEVAIKALLGLRDITEATAYESWLDLVGQTVDVIRNGKEVNPQWLAVRSLRQRLLPSKARREEVIRGRAGMAESHQALFGSRQNAQGKTQYDATTINPLSGRPELHILYHRYNYLVSGGKDIKYVIDRPFNLSQERDDILVMPAPEERAKAEALYETLDKLIEGVASGENLFVRFNIFAKQGNISQANTEVKTDDGPAIYKLRHSELKKLRNSAAESRIQGCFVEVIREEKHARGIPLYICRIIGPSPKDTPKGLLGGAKSSRLAGGYVGSRLWRHEGIEKLPSIHEQQYGSVYRAVQT